MAEVLVQFTDPVLAGDGTAYIARACGAPMADRRWQAWIEFLPLEAGEVLRTGRETTQPDRQDAVYWATGLTAVYLEGALERALHPRDVTADVIVPPPVYDEPVPDRSSRTNRDAVLNPFSVYRKGETLLRRRLATLAPWHLVNIIDAFGLGTRHPDLVDEAEPETLIEIIVQEVRARADWPARAR